MKTPEYGNDRYLFQLNRQNNGMTCEDCGASLGHLSFCVLLNRPQDKPQPDSQSFYRVAQRGSFELEYTESDRIIAHALGVKL